jgi:hypothetical protein
MILITDLAQIQSDITASEMASVIGGWGYGFSFCNWKPPTCMVYYGCPKPPPVCQTPPPCEKPKPRSCCK